MTQYICETMEENATLKIKVAELLQRCDLLAHELEHAEEKNEILEAELYQRRKG
jgi:hypothetical protein